MWTGRSGSSRVSSGQVVSNLYKNYNVMLILQLIVRIRSATFFSKTSLAERGRISILANLVWSGQKVGPVDTSRSWYKLIVGINLVK